MNLYVEVLKDNVLYCYLRCNNVDLNDPLSLSRLLSTSDRRWQGGSLEQVTKDQRFVAKKSLRIVLYIQ